MVTDPIADMLTRIRNGLLAGHDSVVVPASKVKMAIAKILREEGFISDYGVVKGKPEKMIKIQLRYVDGRPTLTGLERVSKPGLHVYVKGDEVPRVYGGLGVAIISTSKGVLTSRDAWKQKIGGELLCYVW